MQTDVFFKFIYSFWDFLNYSKNTYTQIGFLKVLLAAMITNAFNALSGAVNNPQMICDGLVFVFFCICEGLLNRYMLYNYISQCGNGVIEGWDGPLCVVFR